MAFAEVTGIFRIKPISEIQGYLLKESGSRSRARQRRLKLELPRQYYAIVTAGKELLVLAIHSGGERILLTKLPLLSEPVLGVFLDQQAQSLFILGKETLGLQAFCLRSKTLSPTKRGYQEALALLEVEQTVEHLLAANDHYFRVMRPDDLNPLSF